MTAMGAWGRRALIAGVALLCVVITASLGVWQLGRAQQKQTLQEQIQDRGALPPLSVTELLSTTDPATMVHRPVVLTGHWVPEATVFLDNRPMAGRTGFFVLTPLRLSGVDAVVLVQRGWVPRDFLDRTRLPEVDTPLAQVQIRGRLAPPPSQLLALGEGGTGPIRQNVELSALAVEWRLPLMPDVSVLQTDADNSGLLRDWPRFVGGAHKHRAYAAQWFAMSAIVAGLYLWFQILLPRFRRSTHGQNP